MPIDLGRLKATFAEAAAQPDLAARYEYLDRACSGDAELRARVEALLAAHDGAESFLQLPSGDEPTTSLPTPSELPGTKIGRYKLIEQIGEGGFGVVFMAEQEFPMWRLVALKIIKLGMDTRQVVARFDAERQALALMNHPNVAKVFDGGATETGRPYFVMELVKGIPITDFCNRQHLPIRRRLELMCQVCLAVQHAHQKGIIHRDLKPTNVLVMVQDDRPVVKVIDFGVAKAIESRLTEKSLFTDFRQLIGTPSYMSPEQAAGGLDVDTRSDVYSLGVLLYELLTGSPPFAAKELRSKAFAEMQRIICEVEPLTPSSKLSTLAGALPSIAAQRSAEPSRLKGALEGELDWIVMKCIEKDRNRRYETASSLAADIENHLNNEPVAARPSTQMYRLKKFIHRNKARVLTGVSILAALMIGLTIAAIAFFQARQQARIARTEAARSQQTASFLEDTLKSVGANTSIRREAGLLREVLDETSDQINSNLSSQPVVQGDLWMTLGDTLTNSGDIGSATSMYQHAVESYRKAFGNRNAKLAIALGSLGRSQAFEGQFSEADRNTSSALEVARMCDDPETISTCLMDRGNSFAYQGIGSPEGVPYLREAVELRTDQNNDPEALADCMTALANSLINIDIVEAELLTRKALALHRQQLEPDDPKIIEDMFLLGQLLFCADKLGEAENVMRTTFEMYSNVHSRDHTNRRIVLCVLANVLDSQGKADEAIALMRQNLEPFDDLTWFQTAVLLLKNGREQEYRQQCHEFLKRAAGTKSFVLADKSAKISLLLPVEGNDFQQACQLADFAATASDEWMLPWARLVKALAEYRRGDFDSASAWANRAISMHQIGNQGRAAAWLIEAAANARLNRVESAQSALAKAEQLFDSRRRDVAFAFRLADWFIVEQLRAEVAELLGVTELQPPTNLKLQPPGSHTPTTDNGIEDSPRRKTDL